MPRIAKNRPTSRLNLELSQAVRDRLETLRDEVDADSITEVIRRALALYDHVWTKRREGYELALVGPKGQKKTVEFF